MIPFQDEFSARQARQQARRLISTQDCLSWSAAEWALWIKDGLEDYTADKRHHFFDFPPFMMNPHAWPDAHNLSLAIDERFSRSTDHSAHKNLGQGLVEACADGRSINLSCKALFILGLCEEVVRERTLDVVDNILRLHENGWIDMSCDPELVSGSVYTLCDHKRHVNAPRIAAALKPFIDRDDMSEISREEFYKIPAVKKLQLG